MTLAELQTRISHDTITRREVLQVLQEHLDRPEDPYVVRKLRRAMVSTEYYFSARADNLAGLDQHLEHERAMLIRDIYTAKTYSIHREEGW
jgi:hypothetical protein